MALHDRDKRVSKATPARGTTAAPEPIDDAESGAIEDPDARREFRSHRPDRDRLERLEDRVDDIVDVVREVRGSMNFLVESQRKSNAEREDRAERDARDREAALARERLAAELLEKARERRATIIKTLIAIVVPLVTAVGAILVAR